MEIIKVPIPNHEYTVVIDNGLLSRIDEYIDITDEFVIITDSNVNPLYLHYITEKISNISVYTIPPGEKSKSMEMAYSLINSMIKDKVSRGATLIALGGGVVGDLGGFIASIYMRGIEFIQIPTTLLAQIDSSVGGKVGINADEMKNAIGSFYQPKLVLIDPTTLKTLSKREFNNGIAEMIKYAILKGKPLIDALLKGIDLDTISIQIKECINIKRDIVIVDTYDNGIRQTLNYGHTIGHAIEQYSNYTLLHGEAVAIGMAKISHNEEYYDLLLELLNKYNLPIEYDYDKEEVFRLITTDKKVKGNILNIIVVNTLGNALVKPIDVFGIRKYI